MSFFSIPTLRLFAVTAAVFISTVAQAQPTPTGAPGSVATSNAARKHTIFINLKTRDAWLQLTVEERLKYIGRHIFPVMQKHPAVKVRFYDAEFYAAKLSDVMLIETTDLRQYEGFIDALRDLEFWHKYFDVLDIVLTVENPMVDFANARTTQPK